MSWQVAFVVMACACSDHGQIETDREVTVNDSAPLQLQWMKASHNSYDTGNTPSGESVEWHLGNTTILTADATPSGNGRLRDYVTWHLGNAAAFVAPYASRKSHVTTEPAGFTPDATRWVAIYNFEWVDAIDDGECDGNACFQVPTAHELNFLSRVWDIDDSIESDHASMQPFGGRYGHANFVAVDHPWDHGADGGYGNYPDGTYPW